MLGNEWPEKQSLLSQACNMLSEVTGAGKSSLMRILAGQDQEYQGRLHLSNGIKVGYLQQEPQLDKNSTVLENIQPALASTKAMLTEFEEASPCLVPFLWRCTALHHIQILQQSPSRISCSQFDSRCLVCFL